MLLAAAAARGYSDDLRRLISAALERLLDRLCTIAIQENILLTDNIAHFKTLQLGMALELHVAQLLFQSNETHTQKKLAFIAVTG